VYLVLLAMSVSLALVLPDYRLRVLVAAVLFGVLASAMDIPAGVAGVPVFGASLPFAIGSYAVAMLSHSGDHSFLAIGGAIIAAGVFGAAFSWICFRLHLSPLQFGLVSLLLTLAVEQLVSSSPTPFGGSNGISGIEPPVIFGDYQLLMTLCCAVFIFSLLLWIRDSEFGLLMRAVRDDEHRAGALGYSTIHVRVMAVTIASVVASCAGALYAPVAGIVTPVLFGLTASLVVSVWIALGRSGSVWGAAAVAVVYKLCQNELGSHFENAYLFVFGLLIFVGSKWLLGRADLFDE
jgi:branched-chain amino acid transport system permease protein